MQNSFIILDNNVILLGQMPDTEISGKTLKILNPYLVIPDNKQVLIIPYMKDILGQEVKEIDINSAHILTILSAENNSILQTYLKEISGIVTNDEIILG